MKNVIVIALLILIGSYGYSQHQRRQAIASEESAEESGTNSLRRVPADERFKCDGRIYCSQMTSCAEATFFLRNCPGTKMDGNNDGVPCEKQWCR